MSNATPFWVKSIFGAMTHQPLVELHYQDWSLQLHTETARQIARDIIEAAEAAEQDKFVYDFFVSQGLEPDAVASVFHEFRQWRQRQRQLRKDPLQ